LGLSANFFVLGQAILAASIHAVFLDMEFPWSGNISEREYQIY